MLHRKITAQLEAWKAKSNKLPLLVMGARQVGKTFSILEFAQQNYKFCVEINFEKDPIYQTVFDGSLDVDELIAQISLVVPGARFVPGETLLFLDEIQSCPRARTALKFFALDGRFDVIASGSLLGVKYKEVPSYPVGYEERIEMYPLDFEEFLLGRKVPQSSIDQLRRCFHNRSAVPEAMHARMMQLFREYIVIGGMPKAVQTFVDTRNFDETLKVQQNIVAGYLDDIAKYAPSAEKSKAKACFLSIPKQLARDYKKFSYSVVEPKSGARKYGGSLQWLYDAMIVNFCYNLERPELPLEGNAIPNAFKVYMSDTGLLMSMLEQGSQKSVIDGDLGIYKGAIYENIVADILAKSGKKLYYFEKNSKIEVDFIIRYDNAVAAVEVKSATNRKAKSLQSMTQSYGVLHGIKLSPANLGADGPIETLPLYMAMFL